MPDCLTLLIAIVPFERHNGNNHFFIVDGVYHTGAFINTTAPISGVVAF